ncbi:methyl-accepting chemotaxis protein [Caldisalinibacter kiritimatiensis]|uniref:Methyl-accepting chemotaxis sensory transducer n=1 Tax=Caldisalinibacter kiritimatiensis TaxID=1304284 RepID=R1CFW4_9FIRM|nr:methyl-accepting chemotaxis protein [Caldisalinibacter kiritimatiensis]EOD01205.1 methyl-accepting chemotaxis sensory transducer [Caldisalinibacter kiritimatiensis]
MLNKLRGLKVINLILSIVILSVIATGVIGAIGFTNMGTINNNLEDIYNNNLQSIIYITSIRANYLYIRIAANKALTEYTDDINKSIKEYDTKIRDYFKKYKGIDINDEEKGLVDSLEADYIKYMELWDKGRDNYLSKGYSLPQSHINEMVNISNNLDNKIKELRDYEEEHAAKEKQTSDQIFNNSIKAFLILLGIIIAILGVVAFVIIKIIKKESEEMVDKLNTVAEGNFNIDLKTDYNNEFGKMKKALDRTVKNVSEMIKNIKDTSVNVEDHAESLSAISEEMSSASQEVAATTQEVAKGATNQANDITEVVNLLEDLTNNIDNIYDQLKSVRQHTDDTTSKAKDGKEQLDVLLKSVDDIRNSFDVVLNNVMNLSSSISEIGKITDVIADISEQTNLLALNANIEAARAGEAGRGFAVVAEQVRNLAEESKKSTVEIQSLIESISKESNQVINTAKDVEGFVKSQTEIVTSTTSSFEDIIESVENVAPLIENTYKSINHTVESKDRVLNKVENVSQVVEETSSATQQISASSEEMASSAEEVAASAQSLTGMTKQLIDAVKKFEV